MDYKRHTLTDGVRLIFTPMPQSHSVGVAVIVGVGSRHEREEINGLSHFIEHMAFKGTKTYSGPKIISEEIEGVGGIINAYTSESITNYHVKVTPEHFKTAFAVVASLALEPLLRPKDIENERGVIIEEIHRKEDNPQEKVFESIARLTFPNHPLGRPTLGSVGVIESLKEKNFVDYRHDHYVGANIVVSVAGNVNEEEVLAEFQRCFSNLPSRKIIDPSPFRISQKDPQIFLENKKTEQAHFCLSLRGLNLGDERRFALFMLDSVLGSGMSSRLFLNIREKGLAYSVGSSPDLMPDTGAFYVFAGFSVGRVGEALRAVVSELKRFKNELVGGDEFKKALEKQKGPILFFLEDPSNVADWYGKQEIIKGQVETEEVFVQKLSAVTSRQVTELANDFLREENLNLAIIGPYEDKKKEELLDLLKF